MKLKIKSLLGNSAPSTAYSSNLFLIYEDLLQLHRTFVNRHSFNEPLKNLCLKRKGERYHVKISKNVST
jgi:hypothetical protein